MSDYLGKVAIIGASGTIGKPTLNALICRGTHDITVITRPKSTAAFPSHPSVQVKRGDYSNDAFMQDALQGQDVLIVMLAFAGLPQQETIFQAAAKAGVEYVLPTDYGSDGGNPKMKSLVSGLRLQGNSHGRLRELGVKYISVVTNIWIDYMLEKGMGGFNIAERKATVYSDSGPYMMTTTSRVGEGIAAMLALPRTKIESDFANNCLYLSSFKVTHEEVFAAVLKATNTMEVDWEVERTSVQTLLEDGKRKLQCGDFTGAFDMLFGANYSPGCGGDYSEKLHDWDAELPQENIVEVVREVVTRVGDSEKSM